MQWALNEAFAAARARSGGEIVVTGHTDTVGTVAHNDELSRVRAALVRQIFVDRGSSPIASRRSAEVRASPPSRRATRSRSPGTAA
ncbi:OmpA family protein [Variovorax sp. HW608]|uniref:OmpA family protein n=1 Tax=Variovorax sp. HW608 TaxID=1034889 RepID=UPI001E58795F|nr:OmpA family protein [Variovorax sp. HW608]